MTLELGRALRLCGFKDGERFSVAAIRDREIRPACFDYPTGVVEAETWLLGQASFGLYFCGNPVKPTTSGKPTADDVVEGRVLLVDCDPERVPGGESDGTAARAAVLELAASLGKPTVIDSGRGTQAWLRVEGLDSVQRRRLARGLAAKFARDGAKFDATHNPDRLMRLPGSVNAKTGRTASVLEEGDGRVLTVADLVGLPEVPDVGPANAVSADFGTPTLQDLALIVGPVKRLWDSTAEKGERSKRDFKLVLLLLRAKASEAAASRLLWAMPHSKARDDRRGENYWTATLASVRRHMAEEERKRTLAHSLPEASVDDPGAPLEPQALDALTFVREEDGPAEWARLRDRLKKSKVGMKALEEAMASRKRSLDDAMPVALRYVAEKSKRVGWFAQTKEGTWTSIDGSEARAVMRAGGLDADAEIKAAVAEPWSLVNEPFQEEELEGRRWNKDGARLAFEPIQGAHPTWDMVLHNLGRNADSAVRVDEWCKANGIRTGAGYLLAWLAAMIQRPKARTAYLFFHGEQEAGKSFFHEALKSLFTRGYVKANHALKSKDGFNGELANAVLCVIEEVDLSDPRREAHERVKEWVTAKTISVRALYCQAYDLDNSTHFVQCANKRSYVPVLPGDTRITEILVEKVDASEAVPKEELLERLLIEAPAFLWTVTHFPLPAPTGRLLVPALATDGKREQADAARSDLEEWLEGHAWLTLTETELVGAFLEWLPQGSRGHWDRGRVLRELPPDARRDQRLVAALQAIVDFEFATTSDVQAMLRSPDWPTSGGLGRALKRVADKVDWLRHKSVRGETGWEKTGNTRSPTLLTSGART